MAPDSVTVLGAVSLTKLPAPEITSERVCEALDEYCSTALLAKLISPLPRLPEPAICRVPAVIVVPPE